MIRKVDPMAVAMRELDVQANAALHEAANPMTGYALRDERPDSLTLTGPELDAYRTLQAAAAAAHAAQQAMATTGQALREAIQGLCAVIAPGAKP